MTTRGGARPATRPNDGRHTNGGNPTRGGRKGWRVWSKLNDQEFMFEVGRRNEAEAIKAFAERIGYEIKLEKIGEKVMKGNIVSDVQGVKLMNANGTRVIERLASHLEVTVLEHEQQPFNAGVWTKVKTPKGKTGWIPCDNVSIEPE